MADEKGTSANRVVAGAEIGSSPSPRRRLLKITLQEFDGRIATYISCKGWCHEVVQEWYDPDWLSVDSDPSIIEYEFQAFSMNMGKTWTVQFQYPKEDKPPQEEAWIKVLLEFIEAHMWFLAECEILEETIVAAE